MKFLRQGLRKLLSDKHTYIHAYRLDKQPDTTDIINQVASRVVNKQLPSAAVICVLPLCVQESWTHPGRCHSKSSNQLRQMKLHQNMTISFQVTRNFLMEKVRK